MIARDVRFTQASDRDLSSGLLGWVSFVLDGAIRLDGVAIRRTLDGRLTLSFPVRQSRGGRRYALVRPVDDEARRDLETQILQALRAGETAP